MNITSTHDKFILLWDKRTLEVPALNAKLYFTCQLLVKKQESILQLLLKTFINKNNCNYGDKYSRAYLYTKSSKDL